MKAISIRQPWAWAILRAGKRVENRGADLEWLCYRGPVLLHTGKISLANTPSNIERLEDLRDEFVRMCRIARATGIDIEAVHPGKMSLRMLAEQSGGIVGRARIDGVIRGEADMAAYNANVPDTFTQRAWWTGGFALVLADVEPLPFVPWKGALGLFEVPDDYASRGAS